jgi:catalase
MNTSTIEGHMASSRLYKWERWKFDPSDPAMEIAEFDLHAQEVHRVQGELATASHSVPRRVFHAKSHGALLGELRLLPTRVDKTRHGLFADNAPNKYPVLARFSNGKGTIEHDLALDVRGLALKLFEPQPGTEQTVDFLFTNSKVAFGKDHAEFIAFMQASANGMPGLAFARNHRRVVLQLSKSIWPPRSVAALSYGSGHAYLLGQNAAMKLRLKPLLNRGKVISSIKEICRQFVDRDFFRHELQRRVADKGLRFELSIQLHNHGEPSMTPIEDSLFEWSEQSNPYLSVGELIFEPQVMTDARRQYVDSLSFNPWNYHVEHRPLGNLARGRLYSYSKSQQGRGAHAPLGYNSFLETWNTL